MVKRDGGPKWAYDSTRCIWFGGPFLVFSWIFFPKCIFNFEPPPSSTFLLSRQGIWDRRALRGLMTNLTMFSNKVGLPECAGMSRLSKGGNKRIMGGLLA